VKTDSTLFSSAALSDEEGFNLSLALHVLHHIGWHSWNHQVNNTQHQDLKLWHVGSKKKQWEYHGISRYQCEDLEVFGNIPIVLLNPFVHG
jgi:hypothetical protein